MAVKIKLKRKVGGGYETLHPEIKVEIIKDRSVAGGNILTLTTPIASRFVVVQNAGAAGYETDEDLLTLTGIMAEVHGHPISDVFMLQTELDKKVPLVETKIPSTYLPEEIQGAMRPAGSVDLSLAPTLKSLFEDIVDSAKRDSALNKYRLVNVGGTVSFSEGGLEEDGYIISPPGSEGQSTSPITLEAGDWLVYSFYETGTGKYVYNFSVINNRYRNASYASDTSGLIQLSDAGTLSTRFALSTSGSYDEVIDEAALRKVLKHIHYTHDANELSALDDDLVLEVTMLEVYDGGALWATSTTEIDFGDAWPTASVDLDFGLF